MAKLKGILSNLSAFLDLIAYLEGTSNIGTEDGYNVIVGGQTFLDYSSHPNVLVYFQKYKIYSTAAGRYQLLNRYYVHYSKALNLPDFSPESQDKIAIQQIKERKALQDIESGNIEQAIFKCKNIWASFPGAGYGQHERSLSTLLQKYEGFKK